MLNEFVHIVGCHRKSAVRLLGPQEGFMADSDPYLQLAEMINKSDHHILGMPDHQAQKGHVRQSLIDSADRTQAPCPSDVRDTAILLNP